MFEASPILKMIFTSNFFFFSVLSNKVEVCKSSPACCLVFVSPVIRVTSRGGCHGRDGRDGRDGRYGRDGRDGRDGR